MANQKKQGKRKISDNVKAALLRWWIAGMCYFFVGFGTTAGLANNPFDLCFFLGIAIGLATVVIYNPIAYGMFNIQRRGRSVNKKYFERKGWENAIFKLLEIFKSMFIVVLVYISYQQINLIINHLQDNSMDTVVVSGEPFGFATLYLLYYIAINFLWDVIWKIRHKGDLLDA